MVKMRPSPPRRRRRRVRTPKIPPLPADGDYNCADFVTRAQEDRVGARSERSALLGWRRRRLPSRTCPREVASALPFHLLSPASVPLPLHPPQLVAIAALGRRRTLASKEPNVAPPRSMAGYSREEFPHWASCGELRLERATRLLRREGRRADRGRQGACGWDAGCSMTAGRGSTLTRSRR